MKPGESRSIQFKFQTFVDIDDEGFRFVIKLNKVNYN